MYISRTIDKALANWSEDNSRKPLLLRGARQIGKTTAVRHLAEKFATYIELNFEKTPELNSVFDANIDIREICTKIEFVSGKKIIPSKTLLFLDEIQLCPRAIAALRYFYEDYPELHVIATGSLLEFAFREISDFPVGRVRNLFMYPFSFIEFVSALNDQPCLECLTNCSFTNPPPDIAHRKLLKYLKSFLIVGGMPAAVKAFVKTQSLIDVRTQHEDILISLKADFGKYKKRIDPALVRNVLKSVLNQAGEKFTYTNSDLGLNHRSAKTCTDLLELAKLIVRIDNCHANGIPLGSDINAKSNKFLFLDTGLYLHESGLDIAEWILDAPEKFVNRGKLAEMFVGLELLKSGDPTHENSLYYWHREERGATAEVDYLVQHRNKVLPIEVKAGVKGSMKSLGILMPEKNVDLAVRTSEENLGSVPPGKIKILPHYLISDFNRVLGSSPDGDLA